MSIEALAARFVDEEVRAKEENEKPMPFRVLRSCLVRFAKYHEVDRGEPGAINLALRKALEGAGHERDLMDDTYPTALHVGSWPEFVGEIDKLMREEGRA